VDIVLDVSESCSAHHLIALLSTNRRAERYAGTMLWFIRNRLCGS
jgi:hypothetical protein